MYRLLLIGLGLTLLSPRVRAQSPISDSSTRSDTLEISLGKAMNIARSTSPDVLAERAGLAFAQSRSNLARASRLVPEFTAVTAHAAAPGLKNPNDAPTGALYLDPAVRNNWDDVRPFNRIEIQAVQPIWTWGQIGGSIRAARYGVTLEEAVVRAKQLEVAERTGGLYYAVVLTEALTRLTTEARDVVQQAKREIRRLLDEGDSGVDDADEYEVLITEQDFDRRVVEVDQRRQTAQVALRRQLLLADSVHVAPLERVLQPLEIPIDPLETYLDLALSHRPELDQARAGRAAREELVGVAKSDYYPKIFAGVRARYSGAAGRYRQRNPYVGDPFLSRTAEFGFGTEMNLNFFQTRAKVEQARAELAEVGHQGDAALQVVLFEVEESYRDVLTRRSAVGSMEESLRLSKEWLRVEQINFDVDLGDTENLVKAVRTNLQLQAARHQAVYEYNLAVLRLLRRCGTLDQINAFGTQVD